MNTLVLLVMIAVVIPQSFAAIAEWGQWTACTKSCGGGTRARTSVCGGSKCKNNNGNQIKVGQNETQACNTTACPTSEPPSTSNPTTIKKTDTPTSKPSTPNDASTTKQPIRKSTEKPTQPTKKQTTVEQPTTENRTEIPTQKHATIEQPATKNKTEIPTTKEQPATEKKTEIPTQKQAEPPKEESGTEFEGNMKIEKDFEETLHDINSPASVKYKETYEPLMEEGLLNEGIVAKVDLYKFTKGSIVMHYRVRTAKSVSNTRLNGAFRSSIDSGPMSSLSIRSFSISRSSASLPDGSLDFSDTEVEFKPYLYFLYGFGGMIALSVVFIVLACTKKKVRPATKEVEEDEYEAYFKSPKSAKKIPDENINEKGDPDKTW